mmetsp:Transcript_46080/g.114579  ORF Transcript_46080/g.114579 Transcript_46080/m.114579 type:complete len:99 (-) Transcript_46080:1170-1466(-)
MQCVEQGIHSFGDRSVQYTQSAKACMRTYVCYGDTHATPPSPADHPHSSSLPRPPTPPQPVHQSQPSRHITSIPLTALCLFVCLSDVCGFCVLMMVML